MTSMAFTARALMRPASAPIPARKRPVDLPALGVGTYEEEHGPTKASLMRDLLALGPATDVALARHAKLTSSVFVPLLLKHDMQIGRVDRCGALYSMNPRFDEDRVQAARLHLEGRGFVVFPAPRV